MGESLRRRQVIAGNREDLRIRVQVGRARGIHSPAPHVLAAPAAAVTHASPAGGATPLRSPLIMNPSPFLRRPARLLGPACIGLCAGIGLTMTAAQAASHTATKAPAAIAATVTPPNPPVQVADPLPSYKMKVGAMVCGDRRRMDVRVEGKNDGAIDLTWKGRHYLLLRKPTTTGAYHFDDQKAGLVMIQIPAKSMLFDKKDMIRLADDCNPIAATKVVAAQ